MDIHGNRPYQSHRPDRLIFRFKNGKFLCRKVFLERFHIIPHRSNDMYFESVDTFFQEGTEGVNPPTVPLHSARLSVEKHFTDTMHLTEIQAHVLSAVRLKCPTIYSCSREIDPLGFFEVFQGLHRVSFHPSFATVA